MDKNAIKKYAVWAREELIKRVSVKANQYGISCDQVESEETDTVNGILLTSNEKKQRKELIKQIKEKGYEQVIEEVAYIWFNRFIALRFMEVNNYLPTHIRVFTNDENVFKPQIMTEAIHIELEGLNKSKVLSLKESNADDDLYKYLLITQCNALSSILPQMFSALSDYTELLFPDNILIDGSVIHQMIELIPEDDWKDAVQIIGWLYQYYNSLPKDTVFANLKKNIKIKKEDIPAATQLFTPDWIVRYMVENSLGRLWYEGHPDEVLKSNWKYFLDEAEQEAEVQKQLEQIREEYKALKPEDIKCIDPCMGSGHILVYMIDILMQIYENYGYSAREAVASIVENNIYGLDIDTRATQLAYFAIMMKARQYDGRFLTRGIQPNIYAVDESNGIKAELIQDMGVNLSKTEYSQAIKQTSKLIEELHDAREYGSIINITKCDWDLLRRFAIPRCKDGQMKLDMSGEQEASTRLQKLINIAEVMSQKYDVVVTNPPYMGGKGMTEKLNEFVKKYYPNSKTDLFACFIEKGNQMVVKNGYNCMVTMQSWMFISSYKKMRMNILNTRDITSLMHMDNMVMGIAFGTNVAVFRNSYLKGYKGTYSQIKLQDIENNEVKNFPVLENKFCCISSECFKKITGCPIAYWVSNSMFNVFVNSNRIEDFAEGKKGFVTGDDNKYLRLWTEIGKGNFSVFGKFEDTKWKPCNKGGNYRKWYGNNDYVVNWGKKGEDLAEHRWENGKQRSSLRNSTYFFDEGITWTYITSGTKCFRYYPSGFTFAGVGPGLFVKNKKNMFIMLGYTNSIVFNELLKMMGSSTISLESGEVERAPFRLSDLHNNSIEKLVLQNVQLAREDWDSYEWSWDFKEHPFVIYKEGAGYGMDLNKWNYTIESAYKNWNDLCDHRFEKLKSNEEEMNSIFIKMYELQDELSPEVEDKDITVRKADLTRDIKSFISYAVGCMFGRYSLDVEGLVYAGGEWDNSKYSSYPADVDNIIQISDDEDATEDLLNKFINFVRIVYGNDTLDENLKFIADALGGKGQPKEVLRNYFSNDFFSDHCKVYQKRPIYWLFDSGKKGGFKALIYMHRYQQDTIARIRTDYIHKQQARYRSEIEVKEHQINSETAVNKVKLAKQLNSLREKLLEIIEYEEKTHHLADQMICIDLDNGVNHNYEIFKDILAKIK